MENLSRNTLRTASHYHKGRRNPSGIDDLFVRLSGELEAAESLPFRGAAVIALAAMPPETLGPAAPAGASQRYGATTFIRPMHRKHVGAGSRYGFERLMSSF
jgi:hypothetical protein